MVTHWGCSYLHVVCVWCSTGGVKSLVEPVSGCSASAGSCSDPASCWEWSARPDLRTNSDEDLDSSSPQFDPMC